jgi:hypothetical protein
MGPELVEEIQQISIARKISGLAILALFVIALATLLITQWNSPEVHAMVMQRFPVIVGLPAAGIFAYVLVSLFEITSGNVEFSVLGMKLKGAAGPVLMWVICFIAIVFAIHLLW